MAICTKSAEEPGISDHDRPEFARSADTTPAPAKPDPIACPCGSATGGRTRTGPTAILATTVRPASTRPIGVGGTTAFRTGELSNRRIGCDRLTAIFGEQCQCLRTPGVLIKNLDRLAPHRRLRRVDLTQIQHRALHHTATVETLVLDDAPVAVRLAVLLSPGLPQKHDIANLANGTCLRGQARSSLQPISAASTLISQSNIRGLLEAIQDKIDFLEVESAKAG
jgi:hypothetical protein